MKPPLSLHSNTVWPPLPMVALFFLIYGLFTGGLYLLQLQWGIASAGLSTSPGLSTLLSPVLAGGAIVYALYRLWRFHPACSRAHATWLEMSPWTPDRPLPVGPAHLVWQDAAVISVLMVLAQWHARIDPAVPLIAFALTWLIGMTISLINARVWLAALALGFLWPALILPEKTDWPQSSLLGVIFVVVWLGHRTSLRTFPWRTANPAEQLSAAAGGKTGLNTEIRVDFPGIGPAYLGWPYLVLSPKLGRRPMPALLSFWISLLVGWWAWCLFQASAADPSPGLLLFASVFAAAMRLSVYCSNVAPPFNLRGRLATGRLLLPGYDQVFVTPLVVVLLGIGGGMLVPWSGSWYAATEAVVLALLCFGLLQGGPNLQNWLLTGQVRFKYSPNGKTKQMLRRV